ncbi:MAG TPA: DUF2059 domain-containing protein [Opitutales bacterium]|jgi:hypothetical protein|nr:DUF2059 domain-containing protein [Opitutales bacterium]
MKYLSLILLFLLPCAAMADDASHRQAAMKLLEATGGKDVMRNAFIAVIDNMPASKSMPAAENADMKQAVQQWFDEDFKWEDLSSQIADIYAKAFTEDELNQLIAFYQTPLGKKTISLLPEVMKQGSALGAQYALSKQDLLTARLQKVELKYASGAKVPEASPAPTPASMTAPAK